MCIYYANDLISYDRLVNLKLRLKISETLIKTYSVCPFKMSKNFDSVQSIRRLFVSFRRKALV